MKNYELIITNYELGVAGVKSEKLKIKNDE